MLFNVEFLCLKQVYMAPELDLIMTPLSTHTYHWNAILFYKYTELNLKLTIRLNEQCMGCK